MLLPFLLGLAEKKVQFEFNWRFLYGSGYKYACGS